MTKQHSSSLQWSNKGLTGVLNAVARSGVEAPKSDAAREARLEALLRTWRDRLSVAEARASSRFVPAPTSQRAEAIQQRA
jgi:hypothetical protein